MNIHTEKKRYINIKMHKFFKAGWMHGLKDKKKLY